MLNRTYRGKSDESDAGPPSGNESSRAVPTTEIIQAGKKSSVLHQGSRAPFFAAKPPNSNPMRRKSVVSFCVCPSCVASWNCYCVWSAWHTHIILCSFVDGCTSGVYISNLGRSAPFPDLRRG